MVTIPNEDRPIWVVYDVGILEDMVFDGDGVSNEHAAMLRELMRVWNAKLAKNQMRNRYYEGKNVLKSLEISIPPNLEGIETVVGWPQAAVDKLAERSRFDGFTAQSEEIQSILDDMVRKSGLKRKYRQAVESELIYSCSFITISAGDEGEPETIVQLHSAERAAAVWDYRKGRIAYGMAINSLDDEGHPDDINLYTDTEVVHFCHEGYMWSSETVQHSAGVPLIEVMANRPTEARPFGCSRITRAVRSLTDSAVRESLRGEIAQEFNTSPQKYLLGADKEAFGKKTKWEAYIGNIFAVSRDRNNNVPQYGQLPQGSIQNHTDYMRSLAARFSGETSIPVSVLGVLHDQASSAEAIYAANESLIIKAEDLNEDNGLALYNIALLAIAQALNKPVDELTDEERDFSVNFKNPAMPSIVSQADAMIKVASAVPDFAGTDVFFEQLGFSEDVRRRIRNEMRRNRAVTVAAQIEAENGIQTTA